MRAFSSLVLAVVAASVGRTFAAPIGGAGSAIIVHPGNASDIIINKEDTVNATAPAPTNSTGVTRISDATEQLPLSLTNNLAGSVNAYVTGLNSAGQLVMLQPDGTWYYPSVVAGTTTPQPIDGNVAIPLGAQGSTITITLPDYISAARVWFAEGELQFFTVQGGDGPSLVEPSAVNPSDPSAAVNWGFVELTNTDGGLYANISYVDFVGLPLGMTLTSTDGVQTAQGLQADAVAQLCSELSAQAAQDGQPWDQLCESDSDGTPLRVLAPFDYISVNSDAFNDYYTDYVNDVWSTYTDSVLTIDTQAAAGDVACQVSGGVLSCAGDNRSYNQPTAADIFGCNSGPFAIIASDNDVHRAVVPRLCAAFDRTTLLLPGGNVTPSLGSSSYYTVSPTNYYSKFVHGLEIDGKGYAFAYDDVNPDGATNESGELTDANAQVLNIVVGGPA